VRGLALYRALTGVAELAATPWAWAARAAGGDRAARFGFCEARGATWVHAASVGEVSAAAPLVRALGAHRPADDRTVSAGTRTGLAAWRRELERRPPGGAPVAIAAWPLDFPNATRRAFEARRPRRLLVVETELWPNALAAAFERGARVAFANARLSERRWPRTRLLKGVLAPLLARVTACAAQTEGDLARWAELGVPRDALTVTGNTKFDQAPGLPDDAARAATRARLGVPADARLFVWGSVRPGEERTLAEAARALAAAGSRLTVVAVPRHPERANEMVSRLEALGASVHPWAPGMAWTAPAGGAPVWVPVLGGLRDLYEIAEVACVGGAFAPYGGHNAAEPAGLGVPIIVGPHHATTREVVDAVVARGGGRALAGGAAVAQAALAWEADPVARAQASDAARRAVLDLAGATARTIGFLEARGFWG
jgi:3-deoxy-D-manno-octulosonic-acid transferase